MFSTMKYRFLRPAGFAQFLVGVAALLLLAAPALAQQGPFLAGDYCTYTQGGWGSVPHGNNPGMILQTYFYTVYPPSPGGFVEVGIPGDPTPGNPRYSMKFTSDDAIQDYLPAGRKPAPLVRDDTNPLTTASGVFGGQVLALQLNVDFSHADILGDISLPEFGDLKITGTGTSFDGMTVRQVLAAANQALGGAVLPSGYTVSNLNGLVSFLNQGFDNCLPSGWAQQHLSFPEVGPPPA